MRLEETSVTGSGQAVREALARKHDWESHGPGNWGYGVAVDVLALERRISALERFSGAGKSTDADSDLPCEGRRAAGTNHDAAPAARVSMRECTTPAGTGGTQEPAAFAVMSGGRSYDIYDTRGEAAAICRWLCEEESGDIWRVVPLVPADATPPTPTDDDRVAIELAAGDCLYHQDPGGRAQWIREQLLGLLARTK